MQQTIDIVVFLPEEPEQTELLGLFSRNEFRVSEVRDLAQLRELLDSGTKCDAIVLPLRLVGGGSGVSVCLKLKGDESLAAIPAVVLSYSSDKAVLEACYGAGCDCVMLPPFNATLLYYQISALSRLKRSYDELLRTRTEATGLRLSTINAFNSVREGIVLTDTEYKPVFINEAVKLMLGIHAATDSELEQQSLQAVEQLCPMIVEHVSSIAQCSDVEAAREISFYEATLRRSDGRAFRAALRIVSIAQDRISNPGYVVAISDLTEIKQLKHMIEQSERTRLLSLVSSCAARKLFPNGSLGSPTEPLSKVEELLSQEFDVCDLNSELMILMEVLDQVITPTIAVKVSVPRDISLAVKPSHFYRIVGHILLHSAEHAGIGGEVTVRMSEREPTDTHATLLFSSQSKRVTPPVPNDYLSRLLFSEGSPGGDSVTEATKLQSAQSSPSGLLSAQRLSDLYKTCIETKQESESLLRLRVALPLRVS